METKNYQKLKEMFYPKSAQNIIDSSDTKIKTPKYKK